MKNSQMEGDFWVIKDTDTESQYCDKYFRFDFSYITSKELKDVVKEYVWQNYRTGNNTLSKLYFDLSKFKKFNYFAEISKIPCLKELSNPDVSNFISFLHMSISGTTNKPLTYKYQKDCLDILKAIIHWCRIHRPAVVPDKEIFTGNEYNGVNRKLKIDYIPDETLVAINKAIKTEENIYIRYGIIILESTGMRMGDLLNLTTDCIKPHLVSGYTITWFEHKNRKGHPPLPIRKECVIAVDTLIEATKELREQADKSISKYLFIHKVTTGTRAGEVIHINNRCMQYWFADFIECHNILDANGELYNLKSHQFRRTLGTDMLTKGININVIQKVLGHTDPYVTRRFYSDVKDKERAEIFKGVGIIGNINQLDETAFDSVAEMEWFMTNKDKGACMSDGYCTKPIENGKICEKLLKRQKCYTCSRYITTPEYLEVHKNHLESLERQLVEGVIYGEHYAEHFKSTIEVLKVIVERLEELQDVRNESNFTTTGCK
jgi:integrase